MPFTATAYIPSIKPGIYPAICTEVEDKVNPKDATQTFRVWHFQLTDGSLRTIDGTSSLATSVKSKGGKWAAAIIGHAPADGELVAPEGLPCTVIVAIKETTGYEYVENVAPASPIAPPTSGGTPATVTSEKPFDEGDLPF
jgi:hypothetical protein